MNKYWRLQHNSYWPLVVMLWALIIAVYRIFICIDFNLEYYDSDQFIMWLSARNFSQGIFHGPCFYGQDYNFMLEGFFAAPLVLLGVDVRTAVAIATQVLFSLFWIGNTWVLIRHKAIPAAIILLSVWMLVPLEFDLLTALPRGFVPGFACCSLLVWSLQCPENKWAFKLNCILASAALVINATTVWLTLPVLAFAIFQTRSRGYIKFTIVSIITAVLILKLLSLYYAAHPEMVVHTRIDDWSWTYFKKNMLRLGQLLFLTGPVINGWGVFWCILIVIFMLLTNFKNSMFLTVLFAVFLFVVFLFHIKVGDGKYNWIFFSNTRFFIGIPLFIALFYTQIKEQLMHLVLWPMMLIAMVNMGFKIHNLKNNLEPRLQITTWFGVHVFTKTQVEQTLKEIHSLVKSNNVSTIIISANQWQDELIAYAGPALYKTFADTRITHAFGGHADRRYWQKSAHALKKYQNLLYVSSNFNLPKPDNLNTNQWQKINSYGLYKIINSNVTVNQWVNKLDSIERKQAQLIK